MICTRIIPRKKKGENAQYSPPRDRAKERTNHTPPKSNSSVAEFDQNSDEPTTRKRGTPKSASPTTQHQMRRDRRPRNQPRSILSAERIQPPTPFTFGARSLTQPRRRRTTRFDRGSSTHLAGRVRVTEAAAPPPRRWETLAEAAACAPPPSLASSRKRRRRWPFSVFPLPRPQQRRSRVWIRIYGTGAE
jgi:hypothetical protein